MELTRNLEVIKQEKNDIKMETASLISKLKNETLYKENLVDKRVITKFLLSYFDLKTTYSVKLQILETMSSILSFDGEERNKVLPLFTIYLYSSSGCTDIALRSIYKDSRRSSYKNKGMSNRQKALMIRIYKISLLNFFWMMKKMNDICVFNY